MLENCRDQPSPGIVDKYVENVDIVERDIHILKKLGRIAEKYRDFMEVKKHGKKRKYPQIKMTGNGVESVDIVDDYFCRRFSPIFTTFPAPIVINKSSSIQFFNKNFSMSSKEEK